MNWGEKNALRFGNLTNFLAFAISPQRDGDTCIKLPPIHCTSPICDAKHPSQACHLNELDLDTN